MYGARELRKVLTFVPTGSCLMIFSYNKISYNYGLDQYTSCVFCCNVKTGESVIFTQGTFRAHFMQRRRNDDVPDKKHLENLEVIELQKMSRL